MKNIQIPKELFLDLCRHHLAGIRSPEQDQRIQQGLQNKLDAVKRRSDYFLGFMPHGNNLVSLIYHLPSYKN